MWILISWLLQKPADLDLHCFLMFTLCLNRTKVKGSSFALHAQLSSLANVFSFGLV